MRKRDLLSLKELEPEEIQHILEDASELKGKHKKGIPYRPLEGKSLGLLFEKPSTRTRVSFEIAMVQMGGYCTFLTPQHTQWGRGEPLSDTAQVLSRYLDGLVVRTFSQDKIEEIAEAATIPVINGLSDLFHPCQILSDMFTIQEKKGRLRGLKIAYVGDGNNIANSLLLAAWKLKLDLFMACPENYYPHDNILELVLSSKDSSIEVISDVAEAVRGADVLITDVWTSMGKEEEREERLKAFQGYQINEKLLTLAKHDVIVMHCLPARRGEEITHEVLEGKHSVVFDQAENRLHVQKAILEFFLGKKEI